MDIAQWTRHELFAFLTKQANAFIAGRSCVFGIKEPEGGLDYALMTLSTDDGKGYISRPVLLQDTMPVAERLDSAMTSLTHMAVSAGLIQTTPREATHNITAIGGHGTTTEVQLDGHTLRGLHTLEINLEADQEHKIKLGFSRNKLYLDQEFLPRDMKLEVQGMGDILALLRSVAEQREAGFKDKETGLQYAKLHSSEDEVELYRSVYEGLSLYETVMTNPATVTEVETSTVH